MYAKWIPGIEMPLLGTGPEGRNIHKFVYISEPVYSLSLCSQIYKYTWLYVFFPPISYLSGTFNNLSEKKTLLADDE